MQNRTDQFVGLSAVLTGFSRLQLLGTDMTNGYLGTLDTILPGGLVDELLAVYERLSTGPDREAAITSQILDDLKLGPVAQNIILMWYTGSWTILPESWRATYGDSPMDKTHVVSAQAFQAGLQWVVVGAHPAGAQQQGFGSWSEAPRRSVL
jgi:hypothetical protein